MRVILALALAAATSVGACTTGEPDGDPAPTPEARTADGVVFTATTALLASYPVRIRATATTTNQGSGPVTLRFGDACPARVQAYTREGELRWEQGTGEGCEGPPAEITLAVGASATLDSYITAPEILGDSLPDDVYVLAVRLLPQGQRPVLLQAGRANLVVPR